MAGGLVFAPDGGDDAVIAAVVQALDRPGPRRCAIAGGATPAAILPRLAAAAIDWRGVSIWPTDDRDAPESSAASNVGALRRVFASTCAQTWTLHVGPPPGRFDLVWLGLGADGHIASLFPNPPLVVDAPGAIVALTPEPLPPEAPFSRVTLNYAALLDAQQIILVARGAGKRAVLDGPPNDMPLWRLVGAASAPISVFWTP
jgi:6-phosphogluconolactonase